MLTISADLFYQILHFASGNGPAFKWGTLTPDLQGNDWRYLVSVTSYVALVTNLNVVNGVITNTYGGNGIGARGCSVRVWSDSRHLEEGSGCRGSF